VLLTAPNGTGHKLDLVPAASVNPFAPETLADPVALTRALVDVPSESGQETPLADAVHAVLRDLPWLAVERWGNTLCARTTIGRPKRVVLAGHLDTVPPANNLPSRVADGFIHGCGTSDMKSGVALALHLAVTLQEPRYDVTYLFYDCEEVEAERNGLFRLAAALPGRLKDADLAILLEPTDGLVEAGCQGTLRAIVRSSGRRAHAARSWLGTNAIHAAAPILSRLRDHTSRRIEIDDCEYREGLNAVRISGGVAGNVIPDECRVEVNFRFAPDRALDQAVSYVREIFRDFEVELVDAAPGALPGLAVPLAREFLAEVAEPPRAKLGWTDVARFATLGVPALNFGPGDPNLAHTPQERVEITKIREGAEVLLRWLA
jgi:succinyl-diaminopimelate desuccinylase